MDIAKDAWAEDLLTYSDPGRPGLIHSVTVTVNLKPGRLGLCGPARRPGAAGPAAERPGPGAAGATGAADTQAAAPTRTWNPPGPGRRRVCPAADAAPAAAVTVAGAARPYGRVVCRAVTGTVSESAPLMFTASRLLSYSLSGCRARPVTAGKTQSVSRRTRRCQVLRLSAAPRRGQLPSSVTVTVMSESTRVFVS